MRSGLQKLIHNKLFDGERLQAQIKTWKTWNEKVVFTNGVFDLLHTGHITYLAQSAELGTKLIIGINADESVKRLKGDSRPVNNQNSRALLLASLFFVDAVIIFEQDTPQTLISSLLPDVLVKGADYSIENIVGADEVIKNGGIVKTIDFVTGYSSTSIIQKIRSPLEH